MPILPATTANLTFNRKPLASSKSLVKQVRVTPNPIEKPYFPIDNFDAAPYSARTLGADLTMVTSTVAQLYTQLLHVLVTVNTITDESITYFSTTNVLDLTPTNPGIFDSGDTPFLVIKGYGISGLNAVTRAQAAVTAQFTDTAATPVVFASSGTPSATLVVDANLSQLATNQNVTSGVENLNNKPFQIFIPLNSLQSSTTLKFSQLKLKFNFPAGAQFVLYKSSLYRTLKNYEGVEQKPLYVPYPDAAAVNRKSNVGLSKDAIGFLRSAKARAKDYSITITVPSVGIEQYGDLIGAEMYLGGKKIGLDTTFTLQSSISTLGDLGSVVDKKDLAVFYTDDSGQEKPMTIVSGSYVDRGYCGYVAITDSSNNIIGSNLYFNAADVTAGFKGRAVFYTKDSSRMKIKEKALSTIVRGRIDFNVSDATEIGLGAQELNDFGDVMIEVERQLGQITDDKVNNLVLTITPLMSSADSTIGEISFRRGE